MRRREFITLIGGAAAWPLAAQPQQPALVGVLNTSRLESYSERLSTFRQALKETGYVEGQNLAIEYRSADGQNDRLPALAAELARRQVAVLFANSTASALVARRATSSIPIVFTTGGDPVELGLAASLNRPGGNITGVAFLVNKLVAKRLELLSELVPKSATVGMLVDPQNPNAEADVKDAQAAADALGRKLLVVKARSESEIDAAFAALARQRVSALFVAAHTNFNDHRDQIVALTARDAVAGSFSVREYVAAGGLTSYGPSQADVYRQAGIYTGRILKGEKPADLPIQQSTKIELVINLRTAKALGLDVPSSFYWRADEVIE
jgi:putative tryptophan/tyrosine transport system substrate-binding protein